MSEVKRVKLTDDQHKRLWKDRKSVEVICGILGKAISEAAERVAEQDYSFWRAVEKICGATKEEYVIAVDWINREVVVKEEGGGDE